MPDLIEELQQVSEKLHGINDGAAERLEKISQALADGSLTLPVDVRHLLDPTGIEEQAIIHSQRYWYWLGWLEWIRNILVLLPVALTWLGLAAAAASYRDAVTTAPELAEEPFLKLWELRFYGHGSIPGPTFSELAFVAFGLLAGVIFLTVLVHLWRDVKVDNAYRAAAALRQDVESVLWELTLGNRNEHSSHDTVIALNRLQQTIDRLQKHIDEMLNAVFTENSRANYLAQLRQKEVSDLHLFGEGMKQVSGSLIQQGQQLGVVYRQLLVAVERLSSQVEQMGKEEQRVVASFDSLHTRSDSLLGSVQTLGKRVEEGIYSLRQVTVNGASHTNAMISTAKTLHDVTAAVLEGDQQLREGLLEIQSQNENIIVHLTNTASALDKSSQNSVGLVASTNIVSSKLDGIVAEYRQTNMQTASKLDKIIAEYRQTNEQTIRVISSFDTISARLVNVVADLAERSAALNDTISTDLTTVAKRVSEVERKLAPGQTHSTGKRWPTWLLTGLLFLLVIACGIAMIFIIVQGGYLP